MAPMATTEGLKNGTESGPSHINVSKANGYHLDSNGTNGHNGHNGSTPRYAGFSPASTDSRPQTASSKSYQEEPPSNGIRYSKSHRIPTFGIHEEDNAPRSRSYANIRTYADDARRQYPRISKPVELMRSSYDVVVIGSGYGGAVAASRLARCQDANGKRQSVCVLERGKEKWPGEYPTGVLDAFDELHVSGEFAPGWLPSTTVEKGDPTGMYHLIFGKGLNAVVGNGLGGTSLMNANVFLEANEATLSMPIWPKSIRENPKCLEKFYQRARDVLEPTQYPDDWPELPKVNLFKKQAAALGMSDKFKMVPQTTRFRNGPNSTGVEMSPSALTGQDCTGVNDGSKSTTLVTYLADAWNWGAEMFCESEVRFIKKADPRIGGYLIFFAWHGRNRGHFKANLHGDLMWVHAKECVFLGAGAIGSTEILLRSKEMGLPLSPRVGENMSGNGDMLAFGYNMDEEANAIGKPFPNPYNPIGPTINSVIDDREGHENPLDGYVIQEGAIPRSLTPFLQTLLEMMPGSIEATGEPFQEKVRSAFARYSSHLFGAYRQGGSMDNTQVYLVMSHDSSQAMLTLKDDKPVLEFLGVGRSDHVRKLNDLLAKATQAMGGTFVKNPFDALMGGQQVTVHPIGGACMARDDTGATGVTNDVGEVFAGDDDETHPGFIITDASVIPGAIGVNPFATITALAERSVDAHIHRRNLKIHPNENGILDLFGEPQFAPKESHETAETEVEIKRIDEASSLIRHADQSKAGGFGFTEVMSGFVHRDDGLVTDKRATYELAYRAAKSLCESARFFLSVQAFNTKSMIKEPDHSAMLTGTFVCPSLRGSPFMVQRGDFNLFILDQKAPGTRNMTYDFDLRGIHGEKYHFHGYKVVDSSVALAPWQFWKATSTLYVTITEHSRDLEAVHDCDEPWRRGKVVAKGIMHIQFADFVSQIMTMTPTGSSLIKKAYSAASFLTYFTRKSLSLFLAPFTPLQYPSVTYNGYVNDTPPKASFVIVARDGVKTRMHMWEPTNPSIETKNLFMIPGAAVDHQIYALPTIKYNAVNYFTRAGYRVFIAVHRIGQLMVAQNNWTTYDARLDLRACIEYIREKYADGNSQENKVYCIAHCMGSVAFSTGLLDGTIPSNWVHGITCSQVFMNPIWATLNMAKVKVGPIPMDKLYKMVLGNWFSCSTAKDDSFLQRALNEALRLYPEERKEICNNASCHRCTLVFGRCWNHNNLNEATHRQIDRFFGGVNMTQLQLLMKQGSEGHVMTNGPLFRPLTTPDNIRRLRGVPVMLFVGRDNAVLTPEATERTYEILCDTFGSHGGDGPNGGLQYRRRVVPGYGHLDCWMGRNAWKDVYPFVREEVDRVVRGEEYHFVDPDDKFSRMVDSGELLY
ncbi:glucose-methanol-choline oxidoreductase [Colletotrichum costaricense]|uniref:Cholesterol oxidase n=1 Tax=Colletotrichum costaricense TaxID=1209916 RepID=A0AAJ0E8N9_9PEZI|nr:glucose-methanol-choline oxidoreductase [Colletotrichum costaricense]KAI3532007.1 glucose-methanol-choline oxidoreductase [Colletotrichum filicis]KAK1539823.1 glucose-methanol-choline oxidoreductase [Colletotrichum costaricense]